MLHPHRFELIGILSPYDMLQSGFGTYGEENSAWSGDDVRGYTAVLSVPILLHASVGDDAEARGADALGPDGRIVEEKR